MWGENLLLAIPVVTYAIFFFKKISSNGYIYILHLRLKEHRRRRGEKILRAREFVDCKSQRWVRLCLVVTSGATLIKPYQYDWPNMSWTTMTSGHMPNWWGKAHAWCLNPIQRTTGNYGMPRRGEVVLPIEKHTNWVIPDHIVSHENTHMSNIIHTDQIIFRKI